MLSIYEYDVAIVAVRWIKTVRLTRILPRRHCNLQAERGIQILQQDADQTRHWQTEPSARWQALFTNDWKPGNPHGQSVCLGAGTAAAELRVRPDGQRRNQIIDRWQSVAVAGRPTALPGGQSDRLVVARASWMRTAHTYVSAAIVASHCSLMQPPQSPHKHPASCFHSPLRLALDQLSLRCSTARATTR